MPYLNGAWFQARFTRAMTRRRKYLSLIVLSAVLSACGGGNEEPPTTKVYKSRGSVQCENTGIPPGVMQSQLTNANIPVLSFACGNDAGFSSGACGSSTGEINIFEIPVSQVGKAQTLSFCKRPAIPS